METRFQDVASGCLAVHVNRFKESISAAESEGRNEWGQQRAFKHVACVRVGCEGDATGLWLLEFDASNTRLHMHNSFRKHRLCDRCL